MVDLLMVAGLQSKFFFSFTVGSLVALWDLMTSKQSHDGLSLTFHPTTFPSYTLSKVTVHRKPERELCHVQRGSLFLLIL